MIINIAWGAATPRRNAANDGHKPVKMQSVAQTIGERRVYMKLDKTFERDIRKLNGDGSYAAKFEHLKVVRAAAKELSSPNVIRDFNTILKKYGRAAVSVCVAATLSWRWERISDSALQWAKEVLKLWTNRPKGTDQFAIRDNLHPTKIEEYAGALIKFTQA